MVLIRVIDDINRVSGSWHQIYTSSKVLLTKYDSNWTSIASGKKATNGTKKIAINV